MEKMLGAALFYQKHHAAGDISFHSQEDTDHYLLFSSHQCSYFVEIQKLYLRYLHIYLTVQHLGECCHSVARSNVANFF